MPQHPRRHIWPLRCQRHLGQYHPPISHGLRPSTRRATHVSQHGHRAGHECPGGYLVRCATRAVSAGKVWTGIEEEVKVCQGLRRLDWYPDSDHHVVG